VPILVSHGRGRALIESHCQQWSVLCGRCLVLYSAACGKTSPGGIRWVRGPSHFYFAILFHSRLTESQTFTRFHQYHRQFRVTFINMCPKWSQTGFITIWFDHEYFVFEKSYFSGANDLEWLQVCSYLGQTSRL
jgi:hypothetical protein